MISLEYLEIKFFVNPLCDKIDREKSQILSKSKSEILRNILQNINIFRKNQDLFLQL